MASQCGCSLTSKDLTVIEDQLTHLATAIAQHHRQQFDALYAFLNGCQ